jgi:hypothetical protein
MGTRGFWRESPTIIGEEHLLLPDKLLVVVVPTLITLIFSPTSTAVVLGLTLLLRGGFALCAGINQLRATTRRGTALAWWKHSLIIMALFQGWCGGLFLTISKPVRDQANEVVIGSIGLVCLLLTLGLGLYRISLTVHHIATNTRGRKSP